MTVQKEDSTHTVVLELREKVNNLTGSVGQLHKDHRELRDWVQNIDEDLRGTKEHITLREEHERGLQAQNEMTHVALLEHLKRIEAEQKEARREFKDHDKQETEDRKATILQLKKQAGSLRNTMVTVALSAAGIIVSLLAALSELSAMLNGVQ
jgi:chromosome segregation ATPase